MTFPRHLLCVLLVEALLFAPIGAFASSPRSEGTDFLLGRGGELSEIELLVSAPVTPEAGGFIKAGPVRLFVPPGAVDDTVMISISRLNRIRPLKDGRQNVTVGAAGYRFEPKGLSFAAEVVVTLPYDPSFNDDEAALEDLYTYFFDAGLGRWMRLPREAIDTEACTITSRTVHFTDMVNTTLALPEAPAPITFDVNSIKSLDAVPANAEIPLPEGLEADNQGSASFRIPLRLLPGRGGATPPLALSYDSGGGNGPMGLGFSIGTSSIRIDTRFGLPAYEGEDVYVLDGEELVYVGDRDGGRVYRQRKEGRLARIRWFAGSGDWWEVADRDGTVRIYGDAGAWLGPGRSESSVSDGKDEGVYIWRLRRIIDANGNSVDFDWQYDGTDRNLYLNAAAYSGRDGRNAFLDGTVRVNFLYDRSGHCVGTVESARLGLGERGEDIRRRPDVRIDSRGNFPITASRRLDGLEIRANPDGSVLAGGAGSMVRAYRFLYRLDPFGRSVLRRFEEAGPSGEIFYGYDFGYHAPDAEEDGYLGFEEEAFWSFGGTAPDRSGLEYSVNTAASTSLYTGLEIFIPLLFRKKRIASIGIRGSAGGSYHATLADLADLDGDGLPDLAWRSGDGMAGLLNDGGGTGFSTGAEYRLNGLGGHYASGGGSDASFGLSAGIGIASGGFTRQWGWSEGKRTPADVNGDGFLDFLEAGRSAVGVNDGSGNIIWTPPGEIVGGDGFGISDNYSDSEIEDMERNYYSEEPLRKWSAWRSGTVHISDSLAYEDGAAGSIDGVIAEIVLPDGSRPDPLTVLPGSDPAVRGDSIEFDVSRRDAVYFHLDAGDGELDDPVLWNADIRYGTICLFEDMNERATIVPPPSLARMAVAGHGWDDLYEYEYTNGYVDYHALKDDWEELLTPTLILSIAAEGYVQPWALSPQQYASFSGYIETIGYETPQERWNAVVDAAAAWFYDPATGLYLRLPDRSIDGLRDWMRSELSGAERRAFVAYPLPHRRDPVVLGRSGDWAEYEEHAAPKIVEARWHRPGDDLQPGETSYDGETALEAIDAGTAGGGTIFLRLVGSGGERRIEERQDGESRELTVAGLAESDGILTLAVERDGLLHRFVLSEPETLLTSIPEELYDTAVRSTVLAGERVASTGIDDLSAEEFFALQAAADAAQTAIPSGAYVPDGGRFTLNAALADQDFLTLLDIWDGVSEAEGGSLFCRLDGGDFPLRTVPWTAVEADTFSSAIDGGADLMVPQAIGGEIRYVAADPNDPEWLASLERYRADEELFPCYERDETESVYLLSDGCDETAVRPVIEAAGLAVFTRLDRSIVYRADARLPVGEGLLPAGEQEIEPTRAAAEIRTPSSASSPTGTVDYAFFDEEGFARLHHVYIHRFDTERDFCPIDISVSTVGGDEQWDGNLTEGQQSQFDTMPREYLTGGVNGWFYGQWNGYYEEFDPALIGKNPDYGDYENIDETNAEGVGTPLPPYCIPLRRNLENPGEEELSLAIDEWGAAYPVDAESWIGEISENAYTSLDAAGRSVRETRCYTALIEGDLMRSSRRGGKHYGNLPGVIPSAALDTLSAGRTKTTDINGGVGLAGTELSGSKNWGQAFQYAGIIDINGDRFPDLVKFPQKGGEAFRFWQGTGSGFVSSGSVAAPQSYVSVSEMDGCSVGFSIGASGGATKYETDSLGRVTGFKKTPSVGDDGTGFGGSAGTNFAFSRNVRTRELRDINGDGLPDFLSRSGRGAATAYLNSGASFDSGARSWGQGFDMDVVPSFGGAGGGSDGLETSNTGSVGGTVSVSFSVNVGPVGAGCGASLGGTGTVARTAHGMMDFTGDGLPDMVVKKADEEFFRVLVNLGDRFAGEAIKVYRPPWVLDLENRLAENIATDLNTLQGNLDGLKAAGTSVPTPGAVSVDFSDNPDPNVLDPTSIEDVLEYRSGVSLDLGAYVSFSYNFWLLSLTIQPGINGSHGTTSAALTLRDMDGDGAPEHVLAFPGDGGLRVKKNLLGKTGLLREVVLPTGGRLGIDYARSRHSIDCPESRWVMVSLVGDDASRRMDGGIHRYARSFSYGGAFYDRDDRRFLGFSEVVTRFLDEEGETMNRIVRRFENGSYERRGLLLERSLYAGESDPVSRETTAYPGTAARSVAGSFFYYPAPVLQTSIRREAGESRESVTITDFTYDLYGNVTALAERVEGDPEVGLTLEIGCDQLTGADSARPNLPDRYLVSLPTVMEVRDAEGILVRRREGEYDNRGNPTLISHFSSSSVSHEYEAEWDELGNLMSLTDPRGYRLRFEYDESGWNKYLEAILTDNSRNGIEGYESRQIWDYGRGLLSGRIDQNGGVETREYDEYGRLVELYTPCDEVIPAVSCEFRLRDQRERDPASAADPVEPSLAITRNKVAFNPGDDQVIETVTYVDGLGRILQTAKTGVVYLGGESTLGWNVSGALQFDAKERVTAEGQPVFTAGTVLPGLVEMKNPTVTEYDAQDRPLSVTLPGDPPRIVSFEYGIEDAGRLVTVKTDPEGNRSVIETDPFGRIRTLTRQDAGGTALKQATYDYRITGELLQVSQDGPEGKIVTEFTYNLRGAVLSQRSPERGLIELEYDEAGNLIRKIDANLRAAGAEITYDYDGLNRLADARYPSSGDTEDVEYVYGEAGADYNAAGRLIVRTDGSGRVEYRYGKLGEVVRERRTLDMQTPLEDDRTADMEYLSDHLGRMQSVTYPDGERVDYEYDLGGQVNRIVGTRPGGEETVFVDSVGYDEFGQRVHIAFGNGTETSYTYHPYTRRLSQLTTQNEWGKTWQGIAYDFDTVGNVTGRINTTDIGITSQTYEYDDLYQIVASGGAYEHRPNVSLSWKSTYNQEYTYDWLGNMTGKCSTEQRNPPSVSLSLMDYNLVYAYEDSSKPLQPTRIGSLYYSYDANGNMTEETVTNPAGSRDEEEVLPSLTIEGEVRIVDRGFGLVSHPLDTGGAEPYKREFVWDEENRLIQVLQPQDTVSFTYDARGERTSKFNGTSETLYFNNFWSEVTDDADFRQSKHIFLGNRRLVTRVRYDDIVNTGYENEHTYYHHPDYLGSASLITDPDGDVYERIEYSPWGELWVEIQEDANTSYQNLIPFRFTGKERDQETGLYFYGARYYEPQLARWMSADPAGFGLINPMNGEKKAWSDYSLIEATNWYSYVSNNPVRYVDPTGMESADAVYNWYSEREAYMNQFSYPVEEGIITSAYGERQPVRDKDTGEMTSTNHTSIDLANEKYTFVSAAQEGRVKEISDTHDFGYSVKLEHRFGIETRYSHLEMPPVLSEGDIVSKGEVMGLMGETGMASGPHVDFQVRINKELIDPSSFIPRHSSLLVGDGVIEDHSFGDLTGRLRNEL